MASNSFKELLAASREMASGLRCSPVDFSCCREAFHLPGVDLTHHLGVLPDGEVIIRVEWKLLGKPFQAAVVPGRCGFQQQNLDLPCRKVLVELIEGDGQVIDRCIVSKLVELNEG